jgi:hypothetical protein
MVTYSVEDKGEAIHITGGKYIGLSGWLWLEKPNPPKTTYVIITLKNNTEVGTRVNKGHVGPPRGAPTDFVDAALQQHTDVDVAFNKVCKMLAKCNLNGSERELQEKFLFKMHAAFEQQLAEGVKASWFYVDYYRADDRADDRADEETNGNYRNYTHEETNSSYRNYTVDDLD